MPNQISVAPVRHTSHTNSTVPTAAVSRPTAVTWRRGRVLDTPPSYNRQVMLPPSFQAPAGMIQVLGGLLACFAGYRVFRVVRGIYGFILGALMTSSAMGADQTWHMVLGAIVGGLIGAVVLVLA